MNTTHATFTPCSTSLRILPRTHLLLLLQDGIILKFATRILAMLLHKHTGFSLQDALFSLLHQTRQYYAGQEV